MATERTTTRFRRLTVTLLAGAVLAGCAAMPGGGEVERVDPGQRPEGDSQVRVFGVSPQEGALPQQIVHGFLEAITSDEADFTTAREYLTPEADNDWDPTAGTSVLVDGPGPPAVVDDNAGGAESVSFAVSGQRLAFVDSEHVYRPDREDFEARFELSRVGGEWRIDALPDGLVLGEQDFRRTYRAVSTYYYADHGGVAGLPPEARDVLVADPIYLRHRVDPVGETVGALLNGPSEWLAPVVRSEFPVDTTLVGSEAPVIDDEGVLSARVAGLPSRLSDEQCARMAAQLLHTVQDLGTAELGEVRLSGPAGALCSLTASEADERGPRPLSGEQDQQYFLHDDAQLMRVQDGEPPHPVSGPLGEGLAELRAVAVRRDEERAAVVSADGSGLFTAELSGDRPLDGPVFASDSIGEDAGLSAPTWDGLGDLWFADRDPEAPQLLRMTGGTGGALPIPVQGLANDERIDAVRVASDGVRIALLVRDEERTTLRLGRIEREPDGEGHSVTVRHLREVAPHLENVEAVSWAGGGRLVVVGRPAGGAEQMSYVNTDGSTSSVSNVAGPSEVTALAASEEDERPLLAESGDGIARQHRDGTWRIVSPDGTAPVYPG